MCHNCGVKGHKAARCKAGRSTEGKLEAAVKDMKDQADGVAIALKDATAEIKELKTEQVRLLAIEDKLGKMEEASSARALLEIARMDFEVGWKAVPAKAALLFIVLCPLWWMAAQAVQWSWLLFPQGSWELLAWTSSWFVLWLGSGLLNVALLAAFGLRAGGISLTFWRYRHVRFAGLTEQVLVDMRPDANALQALRHADAKFCDIVVKPYTRWWWARKVEISVEHLAQLTAPKYMALSLADKVAYEYMERGVVTNHLVNIDRYRMLLTGYSVQMASVQIAYLLRQRQVELFGKLGFALPPV